MAPWPQVNDAKLGPANWLVFAVCMTWGVVARNLIAFTTQIKYRRQPTNSQSKNS